MPRHDLIVQRPATPSPLVLLFHGVGASARDLAPLGEALAPHLPGAAIVSVQAPEAAGPGWQWFSVQAVTEADRPARVAAAMPVRGAADALAQLQGLGAVASLDRFPGLGHGIDRRVVDAIARRLEDALPASI